MSTKVWSKFLLSNTNKSNPIIGAAADIVYYATVFLTSIYVAHQHGGEKFGQYSINFLLISMLLGIGNTGYTTILRKNLALTNDIDQINMIYNNLIIRASFGLILFVIGTTYLFITEKKPSVMLVLFLPLFISKFIDGLSDLAYSLNLVNGKYIVCLLNKALYFSVSASIFTAAYFLKIDVVNLYWLLILPSLFMVLHSFRSIKNFKFTKYDKDILVTASKESWPILLNALIFSLYSRYWIFYGDILYGKFEVATITAGMTIISIISLVPSSLAASMFPEMCRVANNGNHDSFKIYVKNKIKYYLYISLIVSLLLYVSAPFLSSFFGEIGIKLIQTLKILCFLLPAVFFLACVGYVTTVVNKQIIGFYIATFNLIISIPIYWAVSLKFGINGLIFGYIFTQYIMAAILAFYLYIFFSPKKNST